MKNQEAVDLQLRLPPERSGLDRHGIMDGMIIQRKSRTDSSIPTSSMADIAFLLIIFFMVTTVFSVTKGLELRLPEEERRGGGTDPGIFIHVLEDRILVDCEEMEHDRILAYIKPKLEANPNKPVILYTDSRTRYARMVSVYDLLAGAGEEEDGIRIENVSIPTRSDIQAYTEWFGENPLENRCSR
jgi:biopolymer transport protein ExbD